MYSIRKRCSSLFYQQKSLFLRTAKFIAPIERTVFMTCLHKANDWTENIPHIIICRTKQRNTILYLECPNLVWVGVRFGKIHIDRMCVFHPLRASQAPHIKLTLSRISGTCFSHIWFTICSICFKSFVLSPDYRHISKSKI